jgi:hypothetical protein
VGVVDAYCRWGFEPELVDTRQTINSLRMETGELFPPKVGIEKR